MSSLFVNAIAANVGVLSHLLYFKRGEHHMYGVRYLLTFLSLNVAAIFTLNRVAEYDLFQAFSAVTSASLCWLLGAYGSTLIYRAFFHPLNKFPGPFAARLSEFWWPSKVAVKGDAPHKLMPLHEKYGQFLRIGPNSLSIIHPDGPQKIYGLGTKCTKGPWYDQDYPLTSMHTSRSRNMHDQRRKIWSPAFSDKALRGYEERIKPYEELLVKQLKAFGGNPVDVSSWFNYMSYDVMGDLAFGESFDMLEKGEEHWAIGLLNAGMEPLAAKLPPWFFRMLTAIPMLTKDYWRFINYCASQVDKRMEKDAQIPDITSALFEPFKSKDGSLRKPEGLERTFLHGDSRLIIVAGSDTTAATLTHLFYHFAADPKLVNNIRQELKPYVSSDGAVNHTDIANCEYLNGCIWEALRLHPPVPTALNRVTPPEGIEIGGTHIPGDMDVWCPSYVMARNDTCYKHPEEFIPERWKEGSNMVTNRTAWNPFSQGVYGCIGRPLALLEIRTAIAKLLFNFDVSLAPGEDGSTLLYKTRDHFTLGLAPLKLCFTEAKIRRDSGTNA